ncbi:MAG TPA: hypothetical protein VI997_04020, partial [Candidatus Thermoplasmatota archaeon]|nr:hypothetical protein [Candidatus Thermoplasmatota archaeon]
MRRILVGLVAAAFIIPSLAAAYSTPSVRATETLVEGHTVFSVVQTEVCVRKRPDGKVDEVPCPPVGPLGDNRTSVSLSVNVTVQRLGTAVAVLVRDRLKHVTPAPVNACATNRDTVVTLLYELPGVLWFNDQFLVGDDLDIVEADVDANVDVCRKHRDVTLAAANAWRYPCGGWVVATQAGNPDPRTVPTALWVYQESYLVTDPNDRAWHVDKYQALNPLFQVGPPSTFVQESFPLPDGSTANVTVYAAPPVGYSFVPPFYSLWVVPILDNAVVDPGAASGANCTPIVDVATAGPAYPLKAKYNAVLFFFFEDLTPSGAKDHGTGGAHDATDVSFCDVGTEWTCPAAGGRAE